MSTEEFVLAAREFRVWVEAFDPAGCTPDDIACALESLLDKAPRTILEDESPPTFRIWKPSTEWQVVQRKVAVLPFNGYRTRLVPNLDDTATRSVRFRMTWPTSTSSSGQWSATITMPI